MLGSNPDCHAPISEPYMAALMKFRLRGKRPALTESAPNRVDECSITRERAIILPIHLKK
jgi:hypothetical protein